MGLGGVRRPLPHLHVKLAQHQQSEQHHKKGADALDGAIHCARPASPADSRRTVYPPVVRTARCGVCAWSSTIVFTTRRAADSSTPITASTVSTSSSLSSGGATYAATGSVSKCRSL